MNTTREVLDQHPFVAGLSHRALDRLSAYGHKVVFREGRSVFTEGGRADRFWLLESGDIDLSLTLGDRHVHIDRLGAGDVLGWSWLFPPYRWSFDAMTMSQTHAVEFNAAGVRRLCDEEPQVGYQLSQRLLEVVVRRLQATRMRLA